VYYGPQCISGHIVLMDHKRTNGPQTLFRRPHCISGPHCISRSDWIRGHTV